MNKNYNNIGIYSLGRLVAQKIKLYADSQEEKELTEMFPLLVELGRRVTGIRYPGLDSFLLDDARQQTAEDVLISISKQPEYFFCNSLYSYYRKAVLGRCAQVFKDHYEEYEQFIAIDEDGAYGHSDIERDPVDALVRKENYKYLVRRIYSKLKRSQRFHKKSDYLVWPMVVSILYEENQLFDGLDFRDRVGLRAVRAVISRKNYLIETGTYA